MLTFVEAGTEQAADLGYGDEEYFDALQIRLDAVAKEFDTLPAEVRAKVRARLGRILVRAQDASKRVSFRVTSRRIWWHQAAEQRSRDPSTRHQSRSGARQRPSRGLP